MRPKIPTIREESFAVPFIPFADREDAAQHLARRLRGLPLRDPLVLAIPRGGVVLGVVLARELKADLDIVLARKLRAPGHPELAIGAVAEDGSIYLAPNVTRQFDNLSRHLIGEVQLQREEIARRQVLLRRDRTPISPTGRSVLVVDDGIATGSTMMAALHGLRGQAPHEIIVAVPVAAPDRLQEVAKLCDAVVCPLITSRFSAIGEFYDDFRQVTDDEVISLLRPSAAQSRAKVASAPNR